MSTTAEFLPTTGRASTVHLSGVVLLKVIEHCESRASESVAGTLLGLDVEDRLEVTACFPDAAGVGVGSEEADIYSGDSRAALAALNHDTSIVGWYRSTGLSGSHLTAEVVQDQFSLQKDVPQALLLVYDPTLAARKAQLSVRAYRLAPEFMTAFDGGKNALDAESLAALGVTPTSVMEEVPIKVHNSNLVMAMLFELREQEREQRAAAAAAAIAGAGLGADGNFTASGATAVANAEGDRLDLSTAEELETGVDALAKTVDAFVGDQRQFWYVQQQQTRLRLAQDAFLKAAAEDNKLREVQGRRQLTEAEIKALKPDLFKPLQKFSRVNYLMLANQIEQQCSQILTATTHSFSKLYVVDSMRRETPITTAGDTNAAKAALLSLRE